MVAGAARLTTSDADDRNSDGARRNDDRRLDNHRNDHDQVDIDDHQRVDMPAPKPAPPAITPV